MEKWRENINRGWRGGGLTDDFPSSDMKRGRGNSGEKQREKLGARLQREWRNVRERERERELLLQGGFPEVTVLNITEECGMLNRCQGKHTGRATAAPNGCQGLLYIHTKTHKHAVIYVHEHIYIQCTHMHTEIGYTAHTCTCRNFHAVSTCRRRNFL